MPSTIECPLCKKTLNLPPDSAGQPVRCPACYRVFTLDAPASATTHPSPAPINHDETSDDRRRRQEIEDEEEARRERRRHLDDDDDYHEYEDIRDRRTLHHLPHRSGMIQTLGILSIVFSCLPVLGGLLGLLGIVLGQNDMAEIDAGRMDPLGRSGTQGGRTCAIIGLFLSVAIFVLFFFTRFERFMR